MLKQLLLITLLTINLTKCNSTEEPQDKLETEGEDYEGGDYEDDEEAISDIDSSEFVVALGKYFDSIDTQSVNHQEATDVLLIIYSEVTLEEIKAFEEKLLKDEVLDENEENLLYFKKHVDQYLAENHKEEDLSRETLMEIVKDNLILKFLEEKMMEEDHGMDEDMGEREEGELYEGDDVELEENNAESV